MELMDHRERDIPDEDHSQTQIVDKNICKDLCDAPTLFDGKSNNMILLYEMRILLTLGSF